MEYLPTNCEEPKPKSTSISMSPEEREKFLQKQAATQAKIDAIKARRSKATIFVIFIIGLTAGPAVSL